MAPVGQRRGDGSGYLLEGASLDMNHAHAAPPFGSHCRVSPFHNFPLLPSLSQSDSCFQSSNGTMRPVHVFGCPVKDKPCGKVSALGLGSGFRAGGVATIATSATRGARFGGAEPALSHSDTTDTTDKTGFGGGCQFCRFCPGVGCLFRRLQPSCHVGPP